MWNVDNEAKIDPTRPLANLSLDWFMYLWTEILLDLRDMQSQQPMMEIRVLRKLIQDRESD